MTHRGMIQVVIEERPNHVVVETMIAAQPANDVLIRAGVTQVTVQLRAIAGRKYGRLIDTGHRP
jgi:hypothetical protein